MHLLDERYELKRENALALAAARGFGMLIAFDGHRPICAHIPFAIMDGDGEPIVEFHVAATNPIAALADGRQHLLAVVGDDTYVSNDWYESADQVSTWLYEAVHLTGSAFRQPNSANRAHGDRLIQVCESRLTPKIAWMLDKMDEQRREAMLSGIVTIRMEPVR